MHATLQALLEGEMDQSKLDGKARKRAWFGRVWGRVYPWSLMGWLWTALFFVLIILLLVHIEALKRAGDPHVDQWYLAIAPLMIIYLIVAYMKSAKP